MTPEDMAEELRAALECESLSWDDLITKVETLVEEKKEAEDDLAAIKASIEKLIGSAKQLVSSAVTECEHAGRELEKLEALT